MKHHSLSCIFLATFLTACGGTSSSSGTSSSPGTTTDATSTAQLVTEREYTLSANAVLDVSVAMSTLASERSYLYICHKTDDGSLDRERCLIKTPMANGQYNGTFTLGNDVEALGMEVWQYDPDAVPSTYSWARTDNGMSWNVSS